MDSLRTYPLQTEGLAGDFTQEKLITDVEQKTTKNQTAVALPGDVSLFRKVNE